MTDKYTLDDKGNPVAEPNRNKWALWFETAEVHVGLTRIKDCTISTVFLGINYNFDKSGPPILWETKVFSGKLDQEQDRCSGSREQAEAMHESMVKKVKDTQ